MCLIGWQTKWWASRLFIGEPSTLSHCYKWAACWKEEIYIDNWYTGFENRKFTARAFAKGPSSSILSASSSSSSLSPALLPLRSSLLIGLALPSTSMKLPCSSYWVIGTSLDLDRRFLAGWTSTSPSSSTLLVDRINGGSLSLNLSWCQGKYMSASEKGSSPSHAEPGCTRSQSGKLQYPCIQSLVERSPLHHCAPDLFIWGPLWLIRT